MKRCWIAAVALIAGAGCGSKAVDLTPGTVHDGVEFSAVPVKAAFRDGEPITIRLQVKNTKKTDVPVFIDWRDPNFGMSVNRSLKNATTEFELKPLNRQVEKGDPLFITNLSFMILSPNTEGLIFSESIRTATPTGGKEGPLPPGEYTFTAEYVVKTPYDATYELGGKKEKLPIDDGEARGFLNDAPRGLWRAECKFTVTTEKAPAPGRRPRGGRPMGG